MQTSSVDALEAFRTNPDRFDIVISDQTMPQMTGLELAKGILAFRMCTGFSEVAVKKRLLRPEYVIP